MSASPKSRKLKVICVSNNARTTEQMRQWWKEECQNGTYRPYILKKDGYFCIVRLVFTPEDEQLCIDIAERAEMNKRNQSQVVSVREGDLLVMDGFGDLVPWATL